MTWALVAVGIAAALGCTALLISIRHALRTGESRTGRYSVALRCTVGAINWPHDVDRYGRCPGCLRLTDAIGGTGVEALHPREARSILRPRSRWARAAPVTGGGGSVIPVLATLRLSDEARSERGQAADGLYNEFDVEVAVQPHPRVPEEPVGNGRSQAPLAHAARHRAELEAIALLCLVFAWPVDESQPAHPRVVSE